MHSSDHNPCSPLSASLCGPLEGRIRPPGDKSVSHRSLILGLLAVGETKISGLLEGEDVLRTADACRHLGATIVRHADGDWSVWGAGLGALMQPIETLDFGNAGTGSRLMMGVVAGHPIVVRFDGDASLRKRPMKRILGSHVVIEGVMTNPLRSGLLTTLLEMGADIKLENQREEGGEEVADVIARYSPLHGVEVPPERAPSMIDEYPILAIAASFAKGITIMRGLSELRVKESDRLAAVAEGLKINGVSCEIIGDDLKVDGGLVAGGGVVETHLDHRIAMSFLIMGLAAQKKITIDDETMIKTSFPQFKNLMQELGANFS